MGADSSPAIIIEGAVRALTEHEIPVLLVGDQGTISSVLTQLDAEHLLESGQLSVHHAESTITMEDSPSVAIKSKADSSIRIGFELVKAGAASALVSPGNTGAVMAAGVFVSGTLPGIARPAIASFIPRPDGLPPLILLDSGANVDCRAHQLVQFALMGSCYAISVLNGASLSSGPKVALLSNGSEPGKGNDVTKSAAQMLKNQGGLNFVGFIEGRDLASDLADVVVCDGFVGNIVLKTMEGAARLVVNSIKGLSRTSLRGKVGAWLLRPLIKSLFSDQLDPSAYGGAPLLGLNEIAIICHGSSDQRAITNAVRVARRFVDNNLVESLSSSIAALDADSFSTRNSNLARPMGGF